MTRCRTDVIICAPVLSYRSVAMETHGHEIHHGSNARRIPDAAAAGDAYTKIYSDTNAGARPSPDHRHRART